MNTKAKTPLFHISKRKELSSLHSWGIRLIAIVVALLFCAIITTLLTGLNPLSVFKIMISGAVGTKRKIWILLQETSMLLCVSLALTPAFKMKFWNLGGEGQIMVGALAAAACLVKFGESMNSGMLILCSAVCAIVAGAVWALIPAIFKAYWNTNETLFTLMMNYVATQLVAFFIIRWESPRGSGKVGIINQSSMAGWFPQIAGNKYLLNVLIVITATVLMSIYLKYSKHGYEIAVVGESQNTARYVGINVESVILRTLMLSGAICGLTGLLLVNGTNHTITTSLSGGRGFTAVMVAWLAKFNPVTMILSSLLLVFLGRGSSEISTSFGLNEAFGDILTGIILFFIIGCEFFISYRIHMRKAAGKEENKNA